MTDNQTAQLAAAPAATAAPATQAPAPVAASSPDLVSLNIAFWQSNTYQITLLVVVCLLVAWVLVHIAFNLAKWNTSSFPGNIFKGAANRW